ncbi:DUF167 domain-containing protein [Novosphingobium album (ex Liu et al. 2023)]|uniref:UPF0235 protein PYV00_08690 n=1 Tax=Novosphingobium album (ex Liu et al. 2023) TaxID=3031130 RepID=A0ABT5WP26_9SPHN|nr:DUF167 domain-containing protein [Novosphingobium album (ex Liu et al. 2023)]MDE8651799.1 DUF167 domain-containing protein [Novosphingobium album (ex Liu et al. 2023)]
MARPRAVLPPPEAVRALVDGEGRLTVRVTPGARGEALEIADGRLAAKVRAKPEDGKANEAVRELLATALAIAPSRVELLRGATSREKQFRVEI